MSNSEATLSLSKRAVDNKGLFDSAGDIAKKAVESSEEVSSAKTVAKKGLTEKIQGGFENGRIIVSAVDVLIEALFHFSPVDEWIKKPFFGNWDELRGTAEQWRALAASLTELRNAVEQVSSQVDEDTWSGQAADLFVIRNNSLAETAGKGPQPCIQVAQALEALADEVDAMFDMVMDAIEFIAEILAADAAELSVPVVGVLMVGAKASVDIKTVIDLATQVVQCLSTLSGAMLDFASVAQAMSDLTVESQEALDQFGSGSGAGNGSGGGKTGMTDGGVVLC